MSHPYTGDWFHWLAKCWVRVACTLDGCHVCKTDTLVCYDTVPGEVGHMISSGLMTRTSER